MAKSMNLLTQLIQRLSQESRRIKTLKAELEEIGRSYNQEIVKKVQYRRQVEENLQDLSDQLGKYMEGLAYQQDQVESTMQELGQVSESLKNLQTFLGELDTEAQKLAKYIHFLKHFPSATSPTPSTTEEEKTLETSVTLKIV